MVWNGVVMRAVCTMRAVWWQCRPMGTSMNKASVRNERGAQGQQPYVTLFDSEIALVVWLVVPTAKALISVGA